MTNTILLIEDDPDWAETLKIKIKEKGLSINTVIRDFDSGIRELTSISPLVVILDVYEGPPQNGNRSGVPIWEFIWNDYFVPLIFVSASREEDLILEAESRPLMRYVVKSDEGAWESLIKAIDDFLPIGTIRHNLCNEANQAVQISLTESAPHILQGSDISANLEALTSLARRRLAATIRQQSEQDRGEVFAWEQYIVPPIGENLMTGDVLRRKDKHPGDPQYYRIVLTPSCDLAQGKVKFCLTAKCISITEYWDKRSISKEEEKILGDSNDARKRFKNIASDLREAQTSGLKPLCAFSDIIPHMAISLRELEILDLAENKILATSGDGKLFERVASIDSPYREQIMWAYLQVAGRLGLPERDIKSWIKSILDQFSSIPEPEND